MNMVYSRDFFWTIKYQSLLGFFLRKSHDTN